MEYDSIAATAKAGMNFERASLEVSAQRIAQIGVAYSSESEALNASQGLLDLEAELLGLDVASVTRPQSNQVKEVHDPAHPLANGKGIVFLLVIDHVLEMARMTTAIRAYEANVRAFNSSSEMNAAALRIGES